jgi:lipopolysaccharide transport system ATP-binding protein
MTSDLAISVSHLSKQYKILDRGERPSTTVEAALGWLRKPGSGRSMQKLMALDDVSFDVRRGDILGILGRNGAGKSTLLKVLTRITAPSGGRVEIGGRVGSLLEIGTGFHPELTGRENVYLNGTLLGMKKKEIQRRFDEIVAFAGVERFLDTQVKRFSTGMYVRLAFGVAAHLETEILVVDEVLAVGDADFQAKCLRKMRQVAQDGRTVLLVSHQVQTVSALATSGIYLQSGRLLYDGEIEGALDAYKQSFERPPSTDALEAAMRQGSGELRFDVVGMSQQVFEPQEEKIVRFSITPNSEQRVPLHIGCHVIDENRVVVAQCDSRLVDVHLENGQPLDGVLRIRSPWLKPGRYSVDMFLSSYAEVADQWENACSFDVVSPLPYSGVAPDRAIAHSPVLADFSYDIR